MMTPLRRTAGLLAVFPLALLSNASGQMEGQQEDFDTATSIPPNAIITESVAPAGEIDTYIFVVDNPSNLTAYTNGGLDTFGCLFNGGGNLMTMSTTGGEADNFRMETSVQPGSYYIQVSSWDRRRTGDYELRLEVSATGSPTDEPEINDWSLDSKSAAPIAEINSEITESISEPGDINYRRLNLIEPQTLTISSRGGVDTIGKLLDHDGNELASDDNSGSGNNFRLETTVPAGLYYCTVRASSPTATGNYVLDVDSSQPTNLRVDFEGDTSFGRVEVGTEVVSQIAIVNPGNVTVEVNSIELPDGFQGAFSGTLPPRTRRHFEVSFQPTAPASYAGRLVADVTAGAANNSVAISGQGSSATNPAMGELFHNATYVTGDTTLPLYVGSKTEPPQLVRYDADRDLSLDISGLPQGSVSLRAADGTVIASATSDAGLLALSAGTYYLQFTGDGATHEIGFATSELAPFKVQTIERVGDARTDIKLAFNSTAGRQYIVEVSDSSGAGWQQIDLLTGTGRQLECIEAGSLTTNDTRVFRVSEVPR